MIKHYKTFKDATPANYDGLFDWDFLKPAFKGTKIEPMDLDAVVERKGNFLLFETKNIGVPIPLGQKITLENFIKVGRGKITLFVLYGKTPDTIEFMEEWVYYKGKVVKHTTECNSEYVLTMTAAWFTMVNK